MYKVVATKDFVKSLKKLDKNTQRLIKKYIENNLQAANPKLKGKPLRYGLKGYWRYRIGDYRLVCEIKEEKLIIILVDTGHRKNIYKYLNA